MKKRTWRSAPAPTDLAELARLTPRVRRSARKVVRPLLPTRRKERGVSYRLYADDDRINEVGAALATLMEGREDEIVTVDLAGSGELDSVLLARSLRVGLRICARIRRESGRSLPLPVLQWMARAPEEERAVNQLMFAWDYLDNKEKSLRRPGLLVTDVGNSSLSLLGGLPPRLSKRYDRLLERRLLTYHALATAAPGSRGNSAKFLGKLLSEYRDYGLLVPRGYAPHGMLMGAGFGKLDPKAWPQIWESVPAALRQVGANAGWG